MKKTYRIGVLSDTHGIVPLDIYQLFADVDAILHAGDIGNPDVLLDLEVLATVYAVRGNTDFFGTAHSLPRERHVSFGPVRFALLHGDGFPRGTLAQHLEQKFAGREVDIVIFGHTHKLQVEKRGSLWLINPGCANPALVKGRATGMIITFSDRSDIVIKPIQFRHQLKEENHDCYDDTFD
jgi:hypothetical protein